MTEIAPDSALQGGTGPVAAPGDLAPPDDLRSGAGVPVGMPEIAKRLGVAGTTVQQWRYRELLPDPWWTVGGGPAWPWWVIESWAQRTGRLTPIITTKEQAP